MKRITAGSGLLVCGMALTVIYLHYLPVTVHSPSQTFLSSLASFDPSEPIPEAEWPVKILKIVAPHGFTWNRPVPGTYKIHCSVKDSIENASEAGLELCLSGGWTRYEECASGMILRSQLTQPRRNSNGEYEFVVKVKDFKTHVDDVMQNISASHVVGVHKWKANHSRISWERFPTCVAAGD